jgi:hypothetical protein
LSADNDGDLKNTSAQNVIRLIDGFIEQMRQTRKTMAVALSLAISSIVLAPVAIGLSIFLLQHPSFFAILERENEFGLVLVGLLLGIITLSSIWFVEGIKQYRSISSWNKKYTTYSKKKEDLDRSIASEYGLDED